MPHATTYRKASAAALESCLRAEAIDLGGIVCDSKLEMESQGLALLETYCYPTARLSLLLWDGSR